VSSAKIKISVVEAVTGRPERRKRRLRRLRRLWAVKNDSSSIKELSGIACCFSDHSSAVTA
jgi:hypothetical protein